MTEIYASPPLVEFGEGDRISTVGVILVKENKQRFYYELRDWKLSSIPQSMKHGARCSALNVHVRAAMKRHENYTEITVTLRRMP